MAKPDAERRASREALERSEIAADAERRASREAQERIEVLQEELQQAKRMENLGQLAGGVAHDFNNILAVILNYTAFVSEELSAPPESDWPERLQSARSDLGQIRQAAEHAASLTRQLLTFARREVTRPQVLNVNEVITALEEILHRTLGEH